MISNLAYPIITFLSKHKTFIFINLIIFSIYLFCRWSSYSEIIIDANDNNYSFFINGKLLDRVSDKTFSSGGISIYPNISGMPFDLPIKPKILSIKVEDKQRKILFNQKKVTTTGYQYWSDYKATIIVYGIPNLSLVVHEQKNMSGIILVLRAFFDVDYGVKKRVDYQETIFTGHNNLDIGIPPNVILLSYLFLQSYPYALSLLLIILALQKILPQNTLRINLFSSKFRSLFYLIILIFISTSTLLLLILINIYLLEGIPHVPDSIIYLMQAKIFATGRLFASPPIFEKFYEFFDSLAGGMIYRDGKWFSEYPFGHPLMLAIGVLTRLLWLIPPTVGTLFLLFLSLISHSLYGKKITLLILFITIMSPFFQSNAATFMSHNTAAFYLVGFIYFFLRTFTHTSILNPILSSIFFGLLFNTRILTGITVFIPFAFFALWHIKYWRRLLLFVPGGIIFLLLYFCYNAALTGNPFLNPYQLTSTPPLGFYEAHTLGGALLDALTNASILLTFVFGWPQNLALVFMILAVILPPYKKLDLLFLLSIISIIIAWLWFDGSYVMYGPRYYYEMLPFILLLTGSGVYKLIMISGRRNLTYFLCSFLVLFLTARLVNSWIFNKTPLWHIINTPSTIWGLRGFNQVDSRLLNIVKKAKIENALIFIKPCSHWWCDAPHIALNTPDFEGNIVWAKDRGEKNIELIKTYPGRRYYKADYETVSIQPLEILAK